MRLLHAVVSGMKVCAICLQNLPVQKFCRHPHTDSGYGPYCKDCNSKKRREWRIKNRARANLAHAQYAALNREKVSAWTSKYRNKNRVVLRAQTKEYRKKHKSQHAESEQARNAKKRLCETRDRNEIRKIYLASSGPDLIRCFYCNIRTEQGKRHVDHKTPLCRGGVHSPENLAIACATCNLRKNRKTAEEFSKEA